MLKPTALIMGAGLGQDVACVTDGRFSGGFVASHPVRAHEANFLLMRSSHCSSFNDRSHGFVVGHVVPEAQNGGPIGLVKDGDMITIDAVKNTLDVDVSEDELAKRKAEWKAPPLKVSRGTLYKYIKVVDDASHGCVTDA